MFCLLIVSGALFCRAGDEPSISADTGWQHIDDKSGVALYARSRAGTGIKEFKGTGLIDAPPAVVEKVLEDVEDYTHFMPFVAEARVISQSGDEEVTYQKLNLPFVASRDYTVRIERGTVARPGAGLVYRDTWETANDAGPAERRGVVRVTVDEGNWLLEPAGPNGASTQATYQIFTDTGGVLPAFIANRASQMAIPRLFDAIRKQVQDPKYRP